MIYLDNAATAPLRRTALERMWPYLTGDFGNAASHNSLGYTAATAVADAREQLGNILGVSGADLVFTSGGTESDNLAIKGIALAAPRGKHLVVCATEHPAVLESAAYLVEQHGFELTLLPVTPEGLVEPSVLADALRADTTLVSIAYANNEIGAVQPIAELVAVAHSRGAPFHTDAVQAAGWLPLDVRELGVDALSLAGHKFGAPKGVGVLYCAPSLRLQPLIHGGGQQRGARSGTENVAGVVGLAAALAEAEQERKALAPQVEALREYFLSRVLAEVPDAVLTGPRHLRLAAHVSFCFPGTSGEALLLELEAEDIISSSGSACAAGSDAPSPVLTALGIPADVAQTAVRLTFSAHTTQEQLDITADALVSAVTSLRSRYGAKS